MNIISHFCPLNLTRWIFNVKKKKKRKKKKVWLVSCLKKGALHRSRCQCKTVHGMIPIVQYQQWPPKILDNVMHNLFALYSIQTDQEKKLKAL